MILEPFYWTSAGLAIQYSVCLQEEKTLTNQTCKHNSSSSHTEHNNNPIVYILFGEEEKGKPEEKSKRKENNSSFSANAMQQPNNSWSRWKGRTGEETREARRGEEKGGEEMRVEKRGG